MRTLALALLITAHATDAFALSPVRLAIRLLPRGGEVACCAAWPADSSFVECLSRVDSLPEMRARALRLGALRRMTVVAEMTALQRLLMLQEKQKPPEDDIASWAKSCEALG